MKIEKIFPFVLILLQVLASVVYATKGDLKLSVYWLAAAVLNICVTI